MSDCRIDIEFESPKMEGAGDGLKNMSTLQHRIPIPSSRKFNARAQLDESIKLKLEKALTAFDQPKNKPLGKHVHVKMRKSKSVAEITPTKRRKTKNRTQAVSTCLVGAQLVTPRPLEEALGERRHCPRGWKLCQVYERLMLKAWRRCRTRLADADESARRQQDQVLHLEMQIDVLKNLRKSECSKRDEALNQCQFLKNQLEAVEAENGNLLEESKGFREKFHTTQEDLIAAKEEINKLTAELLVNVEAVKKWREENALLREKLFKYELTIQNLNATVKDLEKMLKNTRRKFDNLEALNKTKQLEYEELLQQFEKEVELNYKQDNEIVALTETNGLLKSKLADLENQLSECIKCSETLQVENRTIKTNLFEVSMELQQEQKKTWWKNTKGLALLSWGALERAAHILLPAFN